MSTNEKFSLYEFKIFHTTGEIKPLNDKLEGWVYEIYHPGYPELPPLRESDELFESEVKARLAAIGHISLLENGEG